jgi:hypothetical protein
MPQRRKTFLVLFVLMAIAANAAAQSRVFVSAAHGDDLNACTIAAPCRSFARAITIVADGGEVLAVDSGGYGPVSISQPVSVVAPPGVEASITASGNGQNGVEVTVPSPGTVVVLRGLSLFGLGTGNNGIQSGNTFALIVDSCNITGFAQNGISMSVTSLSTVAVTNSSILANGNAGIITTGALQNEVRFDIDHTHFEGNVLYGLFAQNGSRGTIRDSRISGSQHGIDVSATAAMIVFLQIENCTITRNFEGITASAPAANGGTTTVRVSNSLIANNSTGIHSLDAVAHIYSRSNNTLIDNGSDGTFVDHYVAQ